MSNIHPRRLVRRALAALGIRFRSDWFHVEPGFEKVREAFVAAPQWFDEAEVIWKTRTKKVRKVVLPPEYGGQTLVFKDQRGGRPLRYALCCSKTTVEAANYRVFAALGIPMAQLIFVGERRRNFRLQRAFLATRFAAGYVDGRDFLPGGRLRGGPEQKAFIDRNLAYVAQLHRLHCFHGGLRVFNFLWKPLADGGIDIVWIDVASCRFLRLPKFLFARYIVRDFANFFHDLELSDAELREALENYLRHNSRCAMSLDRLFSAVKAAASRPR